MASQALVICMILGGNTVPEYQHRCWVLLEHRLRHDLVISLGQDDTWPWSAVQVTQISMDPEASWPLNTNMASGGGPNPRHLHSPRWQGKSCTSTQMLAEVAPQIEILALVTAQPLWCHGPGRQCMPLRSVWLQHGHGPLTLTLPPVAD